MGQAQAVQRYQGIDQGVELQAPAGRYGRTESPVARLEPGTRLPYAFRQPAPDASACQKSRPRFPGRGQNQGEGFEGQQRLACPEQGQPQYASDKDSGEGVHLGDDRLRPEDRRRSQRRGTQEGRQPAAGQLPGDAIDQRHGQGRGYGRQEVDRPGHVPPGAACKQRCQQSVEWITGGMGDGQPVGHEGELEAVIEQGDHRWRQRLQVEVQAGGQQHRSQYTIAGAVPEPPHCRC